MRDRRHAHRMRTQRGVSRPLVVVLLAVVALAIAALALTTLAAARALVGFAVVVLPGAALAWTLAPRSGRRLATSVLLAGLALAIVPLAGLALNLLPAGLSLLTWVGLGGTLLVAAMAVPRARRLRLRELPRPALPPLADLATYAVAVLVVVAALTLAGGRGDAVVERFTQAWIVPAGDEAELGIRNLEGAPATYRVELLLDGEVVESWPTINVADGGRWTTAVRQVVPDGSRLEARVWVPAQPEAPYRVVSLAGPFGGAG